MDPSTSLGSAIGWFAAIVVAIPLLLWLVKRSPMGARLGVAGATAPMRSVSQLVLGTQQKLVTVEVGQGEERRWLVLGVAPGGVTLVYTLTPQEAAPVPGPATPAEGFQQLLDRLKNNGGGSRAA